MNKISEIYNGWKNLYKKNDPKIEEIARRRAEKCADCNFLRETTNTCKLCGCYIPAKIRSVKSKCPINEW